MSDPIERRAVIDAFDCTDELIVSGSANAQNVMNYINKVVGKIKALPSVQPEQQWIPCSERLPEPNEEDDGGFIKAYLVQDGRWMDVARWNGDCWVAWGYGTALTNVIAWMPLPEAYKEGEQDG